MSAPRDESRTTAGTPGARDRLAARLRAANAVTSAAMVALFLVHGVGNAFLLMGMGGPLPKALSWVLVGLCVVHAVIGCVLTADTLRAQCHAGVAYPLANARFWAVRVSGFLIAVLIALHVLIFWKGGAVPVRLTVFGPPQLVVSVLLVAALAVHVLASAQPLLVALGLGEPASRAADVALVCAVLLALMVGAFVAYYLRWCVI